MRVERPLLCLVTDRWRVGGGRDDFTRVRAGFAELAREAVGAAIDIIQIREPCLDAARLAELVTDAVEIARGSATRIVVNDRLDVAVTCAAGGVHLRSDSI